MINHLIIYDHTGSTDIPFGSNRTPPVSTRHLDAIPIPILRQQSSAWDRGFSDAFSGLLVV